MLSDDILLALGLERFAQFAFLVLWPRAASCLVMQNKVSSLFTFKSKAFWWAVKKKLKV